MLPYTSSDTPETTWISGTVLHTDRHLAVSAELNRIVSVRSPTLARGGHYPLPVQNELLCVRTFLTLASAIIRYNKRNIQYLTKNAINVK